MPFAIGWTGVHTGAGATQFTRMPRLRKGSYFPAFLQPRRTAEKARTAVVQEASIQGVSTRSVDTLVQAMGGFPGRAPGCDTQAGARLVCVLLVAA